MVEGKQVLGGKTTDVQIGIKHLEDGSFLILASRRVDSESIFGLYWQRWDTLALFEALKSRGYDSEATHSTDPDRIRNLLGVLVLTYSRTRITGLDRKRPEGEARICANGYPEKSLFRYGLDRLRQLAVNGYQMRGEIKDSIR